MTDRCAPPACPCDCHTPPPPARDDLPTPSQIALRKAQALANLAHAKQRRQEQKP